MTVIERIALLSAVGSAVASVAAIGTLIFAILNRTTLKEVHKTTNGMAKRAEGMAYDAGKADEKANPS